MSAEKNSSSKPPRPLQPVQLRMLHVLGDGLPHTPEELHACLYDTLGPIHNVRMQLSLLRKHLLPQGRDVVCRDGCYRIVCFLPPLSE